MNSMSAFKRKRNENEMRIKHFLDCIAPSHIRFYNDYYLLGNQYRCVWAIREYPSTTEELALLRYIGEKEGVTLHIYVSAVSASEEQHVITNAINQNRLKSGSVTDVQKVVNAESNVNDIMTMIANMHRSREPLLHCSIYLEMAAGSLDALKNLQMEVLTELTRSKLNADRLILRQKEGFQSVNITGRNKFKNQFSRILPASSVANLFPFNYSGHTDPCGFLLGKDKYGSNVIIDFDRRTSDKTNSNILILGNSGQGKSYLIKLILCNYREAGARIYALDPEDEYQDLVKNLQGDLIDLTTGKTIINVLEPKLWSLEMEKDESAPPAFNQETILSQHLSFLRDFFRTYKTMSDPQLDALEIILKELYESFGLTTGKNLNNFEHGDYPTLSDLYEYLLFLQTNFKELENPLYTEELIRELLLSLHSICVGADSQYFNGYTNIEEGQFVVLSLKGVMNSSQSLKDAMLFNVLSYLSNELLTKGDAVASLDEFYLFLSNKTAVEYVRNLIKRDRKRNSKIIVASQNLEDFDQPGIRELTKPLFAIPSHQFLFNAGTIDKKFYMDSLQLEENEYNLIKYPQRGSCLYKCGNERYLLQVHAPEYKEKLFGSAGGA